MDETPFPEMKPARTRSLAEQHDLALAWFAASITGVVAITLVPDRLGALRMLTPLGAMGMFVLFGLTRSRFSTPRLADSIYFMGFLWTLWALIDVLVFSAQLRAQDLYNAFGYALIATASGMFIRLALLQFYRTVDDQEDQAVDQIDQAVTRLNACVNALASELEQTQRAVAGLRSDGARMLNEWHNEFAEAARKPVNVLSRAATDLETETQHLAGSVKQVREELTPISRTVKALDSRLTSASKKLSDAMDQGSGALQESLRLFQANLTKVERTPESLEQQIRQVAESLEQALAPLNVAASRILKDVDAAIVGLAKAVLMLPNDPQLREVTAGLANQLETLRGRTEALAAVTTTAGAGFTQAGEQAGALAVSIDGTRSELGRGFGDLKTQAQHLGASISNAAQGTREVDEALRKVVAFVRSEVART